MFFILAITYRVFMMLEKDKLNDWIDMHIPITTCRECRMYNFGIIEGIIWALFIYEIRETICKCISAIQSFLI